MFIPLNFLLFNLGHCVLALAGQFNWINLLTAHIRISFYLPFLFGHIPAEGSSSGRWYDKKHCRHCHRLFLVFPRNPDQKYCSSPECQKARKRKWQRKKMREDPAYRLNQKDAQERWCQKNPGYWKTYREEHPEYTRQNREKQRSRNRLLRTMAAISRQIAKMDTI